GGRGGDKARVHSSRAGDARSRFNTGGRTKGGTGPVTGGDSIAAVSANGGAGGDVKASQTPDAFSGNSGASTAQSSSTNTGNTGGASSTAVGSPTAASGDSGATGRTGDLKLTAGVINTGIKGRASVGGSAESGRS